MSLTQVGSLIENCNRQSANLHRQALIHKWVSNLANLLIIGGSAASGAISAYNGQSLTAIILSFSVAGIKSCMIFYTPERRALILERISIEIARLSRKLRRLDTSTPDAIIIKKTLERAYDRLDELKIRNFGGEPEKLLEDPPKESNDETLKAPPEDV